MIAIQIAMMVVIHSAKLSQDGNEIVICYQVTVMLFVVITY